MADTKEHILDTSLKLFLQKSFKEVTMKEIVDRTGLSKGAFYHYFSSKEKVFEEVVAFYLSDFMEQDFSHFRQDTLKGFYEDYLVEMAERLKSNRLLQFVGGQDRVNEYFLIFDAMKMMPSFKEKLIEHNAYELKCWKKVAGIAKKSGEIDTNLTDEQVAKLFIFLGDGFGMHLMLGDITLKPTEGAALYHGLYESLKAK